MNSNNLLIPSDRRKHFPTGAFCDTSDCGHKKTALYQKWVSLASTDIFMSRSFTYFVKRQNRTSYACLKKNIQGRLESNSPSECLYFRGERVLSVL